MAERAALNRTVLLATLSQRAPYLSKLFLILSITCCHYLGDVFLIYIGRPTYLNSFQSPMNLYPRTSLIFLCLWENVFHVNIWLLKTFVKPLEAYRNLFNTIFNISVINRDSSHKIIVSSTNWPWIILLILAVNLIPRILVATLSNSRHWLNEYARIICEKGESRKHCLNPWDALKKLATFLLTRGAI